MTFFIDVDGIELGHVMRADEMAIAQLLELGLDTNLTASRVQRATKWSDTRPASNAEQPNEFRSELGNMSQRLQAAQSQSSRGRSECQASLKNGRVCDILLCSRR